MKVVYNACFGGFSLSRKAILRGREISGNPKWGGATIKGDIYDDGKVVSEDYGHCSDMPRNDKTLIAVVEELNKEADGYFSQLKIADIPSGVRYRIDEYDGNESVMTIDDYDWQVAE